MNQRLTEHEQVLLSTYLDNELTPADIERAEGLLASSPEARNYLKEIRAVGSLSTQARALSPELAATVATTVKLTGPAIAAAAKGASLVKGSILGVWGMTGLVGVASTAVVAITLTLSSGSEDQSSQRGKGPKNERMAAARTVPAVTAFAIDSSALIVPEMTPNEIVAFAIDGTLPIDEERKRFITLVNNGNDSLAVEIHSRPPQGMIELMRDLERLRPTEYRGIDSLARMVRLVVLQGKDGGTVVRSDIGRIRLEVAQMLGRVPSSEIPEPVHQRIRQAESLLARNVSRSRITVDDNSEVDTELGRAEGPVYVFLQRSNAGGLQVEDVDGSLMPPREMTVVFNNAQQCRIPSVQMEELRTLASAPRVSVSASVVSNDPVAADLQIGAGGGGTTAQPRGRLPRREQSENRELNTPLTRNGTISLSADGNMNQQNEEAFRNELETARKKLEKAQAAIKSAEEKFDRRDGSTDDDEN